MNARLMTPLMSEGPRFFPDGRCNWEAGSDNLDLSIVTSGIRLLERYHRPLTNTAQHGDN